MGRHDWSGNQENPLEALWPNNHIVFLRPRVYLGEDWRPEEMRLSPKPSSVPPRRPPLLCEEVTLEMTPEGRERARLGNSERTSILPEEQRVQRVF